MLKQASYTLNLLRALLLPALALLFLNGAFPAHGAGPKPPAAPAKAAMERQPSLKQRLLRAKGDLVDFRLFAEEFRQHGDSKGLEQLQNPVDDYLKKHVDNLLAQVALAGTPETTQLSAELMFLKARLFICLKQFDAAQSTVAEMKKRFAPQQKMALSASRTTTLDEGVKLLVSDLPPTAPTKK